MDTRNEKAIDETLATTINSRMECETNNDLQIMDVDDKNYWRSRIHKDFRDMPQVPAFNLDSWFKTTIFQLLIQLAPAPRTPPNITKENISDVGVIYYPNNFEYRDRAPAALLWIHGGGRIVGAHNDRDNVKFCHRLCNELNIPILSAYYRLAPGYPFPAALDDLTDAYKWLVDRVQSEVNGNMKSEPVRIAVAGDSAGGGLAAELCQKILDRKQFASESSLPLPAAQLLIHPMLDDRTCVKDVHDKVPPHLTWNNKSNMYGWSSYLGPIHSPGDMTLPNYMSASRRKDLSNLPPAYIFCGTLDLFLNECRDYARRLKERGVDVEYEEIDGGFHGMVNFGDGKDTVENMWKHLSTFGKKHLFKNVS